MESFVLIQASSREDRYKEIVPQIISLLDGECDLIANLANTAAALKIALKDDASWVGFYLNRGGELVLGPFQGKPACIRIRIGSGVCGTAAHDKRSIIVPDVSKFPGHIYCDPDSKSEIVVPLIRNGQVLGVLDVDSSHLSTFTDVDRRFLEEVAKILVPTFPQTL